MKPLSHDEIARYSRHLILEEVGMDGQVKLKNSAVLCVGTGGLGSPLLLYLAAAGVGRIGIVDFDVVDASNLQRQIIHGTSTLGKRKVISARDRILDVNPFVQVDIYEEALTSENALRILQAYDVVVDGTDNFPTRYLVNDACVLLGKPNVYGSIFKFEGQASVFNHAGGPNYRDLYPEPPPPGLVPSCAEGGVLGVLPGIIGTIQALETIKLLLGKGTSLSGRLLLFDAMAMKFRELRLRRDPEAKPVTTLIDYDRFCGIPKTHAASREVAPSTGEGFRRMSVQEVARRRAEGWAPFVLDVRGAREWDIVHFSWADGLIPHTEVAGRLAEVPKDREILVHCKLGGRSSQACQSLAAAGYDCVNMEGGITAWAKEIEPGMAVY
jgi:adenylyltransferase/sulfurtransferase